MKLPRPTASRRGAAVVFCLLVSVTAGLLSVFTLKASPPFIEPRHLDVAGASAQILVDLPRPLVSDQLATDGDYQTLHKRAVLLGSLMTSPPALRHIGRRAGLDPELIAAWTPVTANVQAILTEPASERRASEIAEETLPYRLEVQPHPEMPSLTLFSQGPSVADATRLADAALPGLRDYLAELARRKQAPQTGALRIEQIGRARGGLINGKAEVMIGGLTFGFALAVSALLAFAVGRRASGKRLIPASLPPTRAVDASGRPGTPPGRPPTRQRMPVRSVALSGSTMSAAMALPAPGLGHRHTAPREPTPTIREMAARFGTAAGDWPRTTRVLPWMVALMLVVIWLVPFNMIELSVGAPIDLTFDRLILPLIVAAWLLSLAAGGPHAPRVRLTWIHVAVGAVIGISCLSLVLEASTLNVTLEFETAVKKVALLVSYVSLFVVAASVVRRSEVPAFLKLTLGLATICALGTIVEYRFEYNVFYTLADQILPGVFSVGEAESAAIDSQGRRVVRGPADLPLEAVAMVTMALPVAMSGLIQSSDWRRRIGYGFCAALLLAAAVSTYRKSAFVAPIAVLLTLTCFRRREMLRLVPLGLVVAIIVALLSPGAVQAVAAQLSGENFGAAPTTSDRSADYDAARPDVLSHLVTGRGYGSYEHTSYRILDMELLRQLIEVGVLGLASYLFLIVAIVAVARGPIRSRGPDAQVALCAAGAAVGFLVVSTLFDVMSFPHTPYIVLSLAALLAAATTDDRRAYPPPQNGTSWSS